MITVENSNSFFDLDSDGMAERTAWVQSGDALLAADWNNDGVINDGNELFGTEFTDGFTVLAQHDSNNDGKINSSDTAWSDLLVWQDVQWRESCRQLRVV